MANPMNAAPKQTLQFSAWNVTAGPNYLTAADFNIEVRAFVSELSLVTDRLAPVNQSDNLRRS
jgi:hypothetical protein